MARRRFETELENLGIRDYQVGGAAAEPTLGFEFDLNYGVDRPVFTARLPNMRAGSTFIEEHEPLTTHTRTNVAGQIVDGFETKRDGPRLEISTMPFKINDDATFDALVAAVKKFAEELQNAPKTRDTSISVPGIAGHPTWMEHPKTAIARYPIVIHAVGSARLNTLRYPTGQSLWAAPQATITLPLSRVGGLIFEIDRTAGGDPGVAFTGRPGQRLGLRSDLAMKARKNVLADRRRRFGQTLSDNSRLTEADYTPALTSFVTLLVMYMLTSVQVDPRDARQENFAKGSLPLNVKTPLRQVFTSALTAREQFVFKELYGNPDKRDAIYRLARPGTSLADGLSRRLFPSHTHGDLDRFHVLPPTWNTLVHFTVNDLPLIVTKPNTVKKKNHKVGDEILFAPMSSKIDFADTAPLIAIEMRRLGFAPVGWRRWEGLMTRVRKLARDLNK
jgi:hypothetical protein